jgi:NAD(P)-dependent dehydrogenase (short-subunit alcohol dehydrogenase family)
MNHEAQKIPRGWNTQNIASQSGKKFLITGGTSGIGKEAAREIARTGGEVIITARDDRKGQTTVAEIGGNISYRLLELTSLKSIRTFAEAFSDPIDVLILNAGVMATPFKKTDDGFELQLGTNHLGHFALAGLLHNQVRGRIVSVSSLAHRMGNFGDGSVETIRNYALGVGEYKKWSAYGRSKLANLLFTHELERRARSLNLPFTAHAVHPGYSNTNLQSVASVMRGAKVETVVTEFLNRLFAQSAAAGALPTLAAATYPHLSGASFIGPDRYFESRGTPRLTRANSFAYDQEVAANLWKVSEELTHVNWG